MKRLFIACILALMLSVALCACEPQMSNVQTTAPSNDSMFIKIETTEHWYVVYHKETKVMYVVSNDAYIQGIFTVLVDENGNPMLYGGE